MGWAYDKVYQSNPDLTELDNLLQNVQKTKELIEEVAKSIYDSETEEYELAMEETRRFWKLTPEVTWDSDEREICEWERDEYRIMAVAAIQTMKKFMEKR